mmetsp:Transcript_1516/g.2180  ORF Transcript_1516/g.2180 Transcript_1516/m.2180 type:complete len:194 (+) Transcript_1516:292-873(+)
MTGNCLGWVAYAFITNDLFVLFANLPGLLLSVWLNIGASKLQYTVQLNMRAGTTKSLTQVNEKIDIASQTSELALVERIIEDKDSSLIEERKSFSFENNVVPHHSENDLNKIKPLTSHEMRLFAILLTWSIILSCTNFGRLTKDQNEKLIGIIVNINLVAFYGAPLTTILHVLRTKFSTSIHRQTLGKSSFPS